MKKQLPTKTDIKNIINITQFMTPLGSMSGCATSNGVCLFEFTNCKIHETEFNDICKRFNAVILPEENNHLRQLEQEISEYFNGNRKIFTVPLDTYGTEFQKGVWNILKKIPYGETISYQQQAINLNNPKAVRAAASANKRNRIAIIIPCHRVIGKNGTLTGYGGGLERKKWLIDFEQKNL
ncbi:methylated-DNA--[protein]-cysteine S-methyltransferase [bacterium]|nr:methylated-DNA--[protein]-cysteine S-methyltransferase [bacterium]